jgi:anti-sigma-K factor RskA
VRLGEHSKLDVLCGEYVVGTLRGAARRRFERALTQEPMVARRLQHWQRFLSGQYSDDFAAQPSPATWRRIRRDLDLERLAPRWHARLWVWRTWAAAATAALVLVLALPWFRQPPAPIHYSTVAIMTGKAPQARVTADLSVDRRLLRLAAERPVLASQAQSFELWLIPVGGGLPLSLAVVGNLDAKVELKAAQAARLAPGAKLAISVEPAGGSPMDGPSGPIILIGDVQSVPSDAQGAKEG